MERLVADLVFTVTISASASNSGFRLVWALHPVVWETPNLPEEIPTSEVRHASISSAFLHESHTACLVEYIDVGNTTTSVYDGLHVDLRVAIVASVTPESANISSGSTPTFTNFAEQLLVCEVPFSPAGDVRISLSNAFDEL